MAFLRQCLYSVRALHDDKPLLPKLQGPDAHTIAVIAKSAPCYRPDEKLLGLVADDSQPNDAPRLATSNSVCFESSEDCGSPKV